VEARTGIEPVYAALQAAASPLCHLASVLSTKWPPAKRCYTSLRGVAVYRPAPWNQCGSDFDGNCRPLGHNRRMHRYFSRITGLVLLALISSCGQPTGSTASNAAIEGLGPHLAVSPDGTAVVSYVAATGTGHALRFHVIRDGVWGAVQTVAEGENWFVNWADFPSLTPITDALWAAHWLVRREAGGYAYDVHASVSEDAGQSWSTPFLLHDDGTDTEHGFVTMFPSGDRIAAIWLDGRNMVGAAESDDSKPPTGGMTLRSGQFDASGIVSDQQVVDGLTCDCCQTDVALTNAGPVAVYRNRTEAEIRDIYISHFVDGSWQDEHPIHNDNWTIAGCPVNGPVVKASGATVVVTWFTGANDNPTVKTAWSRDAGRTFSAPTIVADTNVVGYVGSAFLSDESVIASWICKGAAGRNAICYQEVNENGTLGALNQLETHGVVARMSVPQLAKVDDQLLFVWTDRVDDQFRISSKFVSIDSIADPLNLAQNR
jgi:hypothetical protein